MGVRIWFKHEAFGFGYSTTYLDKESDSLTAIQETVVVGESEVHHLFLAKHQYPVTTMGKGKRSERGLSYRANFNLAIHSDGLVLDGVETEDG
jgi:hypothetical protein